MLRIQWTMVSKAADLGDPLFLMPRTCVMMSTGTGKTIVLFFSAEMLFSVCR